MKAAEAACIDTVRHVLTRELESAIQVELGPGPWLTFEEDASSHSPVLFLHYPTTQPPMFEYLKRSVKLEFGSPTDQQPTGHHPVRPWIADVLPRVFADWQCEVVALDLQRTFWEKATILHAEYHRPAGSTTPDRYARHYADTAALLVHHAGPAALARADVRERVVAWKSRFFSSAWARYDLAQPPTFRLVPASERIPAIRQDYEKMREMYLNEPTPFDQVLATLSDAEESINR